MLAMNNAAVPAVNPHDEASFAELVAMADRAWVADDGTAIGALLVAFGPGAEYQSMNYQWLSERYDQFAYVDRIVVAPTYRRLGLAGRLYDSLAAHALATDCPTMLCEVNVEPPNPASIAFHQASGWTAVEDLEHEPGKVVRFFSRRLGPTAGPPSREGT
jgi:predicted GNAT superfamily acetyltransferase